MWPHKYEMKDVSTPDEMRAEIFTLSCHDSWVRRVMDTAGYRGLSGEDRYVMLAYYALNAKVNAEKSVLEFVSLAPPRQTIIKTDKGEE